MPSAQRERPDEPLVDVLGQGQRAILWHGQQAAAGRQLRREDVGSCRRDEALQAQKSQCSCGFS